MITAGYWFSLLGGALQLQAALAQQTCNGYADYVRFSPFPLEAGLLSSNQTDPLNMSQCSKQYDQLVMMCVELQTRRLELVPF